MPMLSPHSPHHRQANLKASPSTRTPTERYASPDYNKKCRQIKPSQTVTSLSNQYSHRIKYYVQQGSYYNTKDRTEKINSRVISRPRAEKVCEKKQAILLPIACLSVSKRRVEKSRTPLRRKIAFE